MNQMEDAKMVRKLNPDGKVGCYGCTKIEPTSPSGELVSSYTQKNGSVFPAPRKSVLAQILKSVVPTTGSPPQSNNKAKQRHPPHQRAHGPWLKKRRCIEDGSCCNILVFSGKVIVQFRTILYFLPLAVEVGSSSRHEVGPILS